VFRIGGEISGNGRYIASAPNALTIFSSNAPQKIPAITYAKIRIAGGNKKSYGLSAPLLVLENFDFESGKLVMGSQHIQLAPGATITNYDNNRYFIPEYVGRTGLLMPVGTEERLFPIGTATGYAPVRVTRQGEPADVLAMVLEGAYRHFSGGDAQGMPIAVDVVNKTWAVYGPDEAFQPGKISLTVQWSDTDEQPGFNRGSCGLATILGSSYASYWQSDEVKSASGSNPYTLSRKNVDSGIFAIANEEVLPVRLINFKANQEGHAVALDWETADAVNVSHFEVEKSRDGKAFTRILKEPFVEGKHTYRAIDPAFHQSLAAGESLYYRLKMVDNDATFAYSSIVHVNSDPKLSPVIFGSPNPFGNKITLQVPWNLSKSPKLTLTNIAGQNIPMKKVELSLNEINIEVDQTLPAGRYILNIQDQDAVKSVQLVKE